MEEGRKKMLTQGREILPQITRRDYTIRGREIKGGIYLGKGKFKIVYVTILKFVILQNINVICSMLLEI